MCTLSLTVPTFFIVRRKLRSDVSNNFPSLSQDEISELVPNKEEISVMRLMTHSGQNITVFCLSGEPIFFEVDKRVIPTGNYAPREVIFPQQSKVRLRPKEVLPFEL